MDILPHRFSQAYQNPVFDSMAGVSIAGLLGMMGIALTEVRTPAQAVDAFRG